MKPKNQIIKQIDDETYFTKEVMAVLQEFKSNIDKRLSSVTKEFCADESLKHEKLALYDGTNTVKNFILLNIEMKTAFIQLVPQTQFAFEANPALIYSSSSLFSVPIKVATLQGKGVVEYTLYTLHFEMLGSIPARKCEKLLFRGVAPYNKFMSLSINRPERKTVELFNDLLKSEISEVCKLQSFL
jgi:hypothetical protein